ncbi:hypothetical protein T484DRAFT_1956326 [Baffinella frigidus]|nr:hypothetical protein T484DRAFT_1956326 [Cryptophyta sp. CCMP2293]
MPLEPLIDLIRFTRRDAAPVIGILLLLLLLSMFATSMATRQLGAHTVRVDACVALPVVHVAHHFSRLSVLPSKGPRPADHLPAAATWISCAHHTAALPTPGAVAAEGAILAKRNAIPVPTRAVVLALLLGAHGAIVYPHRLRALMELMEL